VRHGGDAERDIEMNRRAVIVRLLLVSGAIVNIAMVWGIAMWSRGGPLKQPWETTAEEAVAIYHRHILGSPARSPGLLAHLGR
jgi:hypothetical protein